MTEDDITKLREEIADIPLIPTDLVEYLEATYAPKCWYPENETEAQHHRFAGMAILTAHLREVHDAQRKITVADIGLEPGAKHVLEEGGA